MTEEFDVSHDDDHHHDEMEIMIDTIRHMCQQESLPVYRKYDWLETTTTTTTRTTTIATTSSHTATNTTALSPITTASEQQQAQSDQRQRSDEDDNSTIATNELDYYYYEDDDNNDDDDTTSPTCCRDMMLVNESTKVPNNSMKKIQPQHHQHQQQQQPIVVQEVIIRKQQQLGQQKPEQQEETNVVVVVVDNDEDDVITTTEAAPSSSHAEDVDVDMICRMKMMNWCHDVCDYFRFSRDKYHIIDRTFSYLDRLMIRFENYHHHDVVDDHDKNKKSPIAASVLLYDRSLYQLCCMTCLYITIKIHQPVAINLELLSQLSHGLYNVEQITAMEQMILHKLHWYVNPPTILSYIQGYIHIIVHYHQQQQEQQQDQLSLSVLSILCECFFGTDATRRDDMIQQVIYPQIDVALIDYSFMTIKPSIIAYHCINHAYHYLANSILKFHQQQQQQQQSHQQQHHHHHVSLIQQQHDDDWDHIDDIIQTSIGYHHNYNEHMSLSQQKQLYDAMLLPTTNKQSRRHEGKDNNVF